MTAIDHPSTAALADFLSGRLSAVELAEIELHVGGCEVCCATLRTLPQDPLAAQLRIADTSDLVGETIGLSSASKQALAASGSDIPPELASHPRYRIVQPLGVGGMGAVFLAEHRLMERQVAIKVIHPQFLGNSHAVERFRQDVKAAARLTHRNIVAAYDAEQAGGLHFLAMEYVEGISLAALVDRRGRLPVLHACNYTMQAAVGLQHAHEHGMVHRDIKPQNIMRTLRGTIKILDFGLARFAGGPGGEAAQAALTMAGSAMGTPDYIAPEQARDSRLADTRADIYSLGCTLYFLLTGRVPFPGGTGLEKIVAHLQRTPTPVATQRDDVPTGVLQILKKMLAKDPAQRYQEPREVAEALRPFALPGEPIEVGAKSNLTASPPAETSPPVDAPPLDVPPPDVPPPDVLSAFAALAPAPLLPTIRRRDYRRPWWVEHRLALISSGAALLALLAAMFVLPRLMSGSGNVPGSGNGTNQGKTNLGKAGQVPRIPNQSSPATLPTIAAQPTANEQWTDLMPLIDPQRHSVAGGWRQENGGLHVAAFTSARLVVPGQVPAEYDLETEFTRHSGARSVCLIFVAGGNQATFEIDAWDAGAGGFQNVGGHDLREGNPTRVDDIRITNGRRTTLGVQVRRDRVEGYVDGRLIATYRGDGSDLELPPVWQLPPRVLGLGAYECDTTFHRIRMRPR